MKENYWEIGSRAYLKIKGMWKWTQEKPVAEKPTEMSADEIAMSELTLLIDPSLYDYVGQAKTTKDAWDALASAFQDSGTSLNIFTLQKFVSTKTADFKTMEEYVNEMLELWRKAQVAGYSWITYVVGIAS